MPDTRPFTVIGDTEEMTGVAGLPYVPAIRVPAGADLIFVSGVLGGRTAEDTGEDLASEVHRMFRNLQKILGMSGASIADVISVTKVLVDIDRDNDTVVEIMHEYFDRMPTSTTFEAPRLVPRDLRVEVNAIAAVRPS